VTRQVALRGAAACAAVFVAVMAFDLAVRNPRLGGPHVCLQDAGSAQAYQADGPGAYAFDRKSGRPVRMPASMALAMTIKGIFSPAYSGEAACGAKAMTKTVDGLLALLSLLLAVVALLMAAFARPQAVATPPTPGSAVNAADSAQAPLQ